MEDSVCVRRHRVYGPDERGVINVHKEEYLKATSAEQRKQIAQQVLADLFNHWAERGVQITDPEPRTKVRRIGIGSDGPLTGAEGTCGMDPQYLANLPTFKVSVVAVNKDEAE